MLSYRHSFHAGNHADVLKHIVLMLILENLSLKEKGFYYLDTHSGVGRYRLSSNESEKTGEYKEGIGRLWDKTDLPAEVARYVDLIKKLNYGGKELRYYAGSPMIAAQLLRPQDRALLTEFFMIRQLMGKQIERLIIYYMLIENLVFYYKYFCCLTLQDKM
jgi:23S rRNA (adenine2030-N6)-methyltransferase